MKYNDFRKYIKQIVLYQSRNKNHKHWNISRKCEVNFTTRQLSKLCKVSHTTISIWLKKLVKDGDIKLQREVRSAYKNPMRFYLHVKVLDILKSVAKVKAYNFIKRKRESCKNFTLKEFININSVNKWKLNIMDTIEQPDFLLKSRNGLIFLNNISKTGRDVTKTIPHHEACNFFANLIKTL